MRRKNYIYLIACIISVLVIGMLVYFNRDSYDDIQYIATLNSTKIPIEEYNLYLRTQISNFESIAGTTSIWKTDLDGMPLQEVAKQNALDSVVSVRVTNMQASNYGAYLSDEDKAEALASAELLYETFTLEEAEKIQFETVLDVIEQGILRDKIFDEITGRYNSQQEKEEIFNHIFQIWLQDVEVEKNTEVWDSIIINIT